MENKGLGDTLEDYLDYYGFDVFWWIKFKKKWFPWNWKRPIETIGCSCEFRKKVLNTLFPYFWRK